MTAIRGFARYLVGIDPATEVPPRGLLPQPQRWQPPFIYSAADIELIMDRAAGFTPLAVLYAAVLPGYGPRRLLIAVGAGPPPDAQGATGRVCAVRTMLRVRPDGLVIGVLSRGSWVTILASARHRQWVKVRSPLPARGWIRSGALCGRS